MDPLSITTAVVACLQTSFSILSWWYSVRTEMRTLPYTLIQIIEEVRDLRNLMETIEPILTRDEDSDNTDAAQQDISQKISESIKPVIVNCLSELQILQDRIRIEKVETMLESKKKALLQSLIWRLKGNEAKESIVNLQRCKASLNLAMSSNNS